MATQRPMGPLPAGLSSVPVRKPMSAALAAAEAAPLDVERLARAVATVEGHARPSQSWLERVAREYAALRSPDTETAGEAG
jgi:hypothetical protein